MAPGAFAGARRWYVALRETAARLRAKNVVNVRALIEKTSAAEHASTAEAYFADVGWHTPHARKPFADPAEAAALLRSLGVLVPHLDLFPGARVLDFGAGTCWSSLIWGYLGCEVTACDVSANALRFGEERVRADPIGRDLPIAFLHYDGSRLDVPDASFDRVVGIDTLHHVLDMPATLRELSRVVRSGGIAAFSEPGPFHSLSAQSQFEMSTHGVIENDIHIEAIEREALAAGFERMQVAWFTPEARLLGVHEFDRLMHAKIAAPAARGIVREIGQGLGNIRVFFLYKGGTRTPTSLDRAGLIAVLKVDLRREGEHVRGTVKATNAGSAVWLPSGGGRGEVNVGLQVLHTDGTFERDFAHVPLSPTPVGPGETACAHVDIVCAHGGTLTVDLVAEGVTWFAALGSATVSVPLG